jgi:hydrogenase maturation protease
MNPEIKPSVYKGSDILIVGVGNEYRGDDGVGLFMAGQLKRMRLPNTRVLLHRGEGTSLMETWEGAQAVILLDAVQSCAPPGHIFRFDATRQSISRGLFNYSTHYISVAEVVELAKTLNQLPPYFVIYGIEGERYHTGVGLSSEVEKAAADLIERATGDVYELSNLLSPQKRLQQ